MRMDCCRAGNTARLSWVLGKIEAGSFSSENSLERLPKVGCTWTRLQVSSELLEDCFQDNLGEHVVLLGQILNDFKVVHIVELFK